MLKTNLIVYPIFNKFLTWEKVLPYILVWKMLKYKIYYPKVKKSDLTMNHNL